MITGFANTLYQQIGFYTLITFGKGNWWNRHVVETCRKPAFGTFKMHVVMMVSVVFRMAIVFTKGIFNATLIV